MAINPQQSAQLTQRTEQTLSPVQMASLNLLSAPLMELDNILQTELADNPLLEVNPDGAVELIGDPVGELSARESAGDPADDESDWSMLGELAEDWSKVPFEYAGGTDDRENDDRHDFQMDNLTGSASLLDNLLEQLNFSELPAKTAENVRILIGYLDEHGLLAVHPADIAMSEDLSMDEVAEALAVLQRFDPPGVGALDTAESLKLQLERMNYPDKRIYRLLFEFRSDVEQNRLPHIARALDVSIDTVYGYLEVLKKLNPLPDNGLNTSPGGAVIIPEMEVVITPDKELEIAGLEEKQPRLYLNANYLKMLEDPLLDADTKAYLREKLAAAAALIKGLEDRGSTMQRITRLLMERQRDFFFQGENALKPLTMLEVARALELHETTISRAVNGKYLATPQGVIEYRKFFGSGFTTSEGEEISTHRIKALIAELIENENPAKPLSDAAIAEKLAESGFDVARRTVAKYRESLNIPATNLRRIHK